MTTYSEKFKDPRWQKKRLKILERDNFKCIFCKDEKSTLHIHHLIYIKGNEPWEYNNKLLATLCEQCHEWVGEIDIKTMLAEHIFIHGNNVALKWFLSDPVCKTLFIACGNQLSIQDEYKRDMDIKKWLKNNPNS